MLKKLIKRRKPFVPTVGNVYRNEGGGTYKCLSVSPELNTARMVNTVTGWTFTAHGLGVYPDNTIDWDWSKNGYFDKEYQHIWGFVHK